MYHSFFEASMFLFCLTFVTSNGEYSLWSEPVSDMRLCVADEEKKPSCQAKVLSDFLELFKTPEFDPTKETFLLAHGWMQSAEDEVIVMIIDAIFKGDLHEKMNILVLHMPSFLDSSINNMAYFYAARNVPKAGKIVGDTLNKAIELGLIKPEDLNLVGLSLGSHLCGYIAREINGEVNTIVGLDPAGPGFDSKLQPLTKLQHVSKSDAKYVHFYHTNSAAFGTGQRIATADFDFNEGPMQPGCVASIEPKCSHKRAFFLFADVLLGTRNMTALSCNSLTDFEFCRCRGSPTVTLQYPIDTSAQGIYFLKTTAKAPYGLGADGITCWGDQWTALQKKIEEEQQRAYTAVIMVIHRFTTNLELLKKKETLLMMLKPAQNP